MGDKHGDIHWTELHSWDAEKSAAFYTATLGWRFETMPMADGTQYWLAMNGDAPVAGVFPMTEPAFTGMPEHWMTYFAVDDIDASVAALPAAGGMVLRAPFDVEGVGRIAIVQDSGGAAIGLMTPASRQQG